MTWGSCGNGLGVLATRLAPDTCNICLHDSNDSNDSNDSDETLCDSSSVNSQPACSSTSLRLSNMSIPNAALQKVRFIQHEAPKQSLIANSCYKKSKSRPFNHNRKSHKPRQRLAGRDEKPD